MGHRPPPRPIILKWDTDHRMHGFELEARGLRLGAMLDLAAMYVGSGIGQKEDEDELTLEDLNLMLSMFRVLVGNDDEVAAAESEDPPRHVEFKPGLIVSWNRDGDDGNPLPVSMTGIRELEMWEFQDVMSGYLEAGGVKLEDPLSDDSKSGTPSGAPSALTELESLSQLN